ncbi:MAG TPA: ROK family protein [Thermodesulfovibrionales bacterium]|nr:ROK family protein [Thermodesulfovibrionales bacterium]
MDKRHAIGIDLGGTNLRCAVISRDGEIIRKVSEPTSDSIEAEIFRLIDRVLADDVAGVGLGVAGLIDRRQGRVLVSPNLPGIEHIDFVSGIRQRFNLPVFVENDANAAALGELISGAGKGLSNFVLFTLGTGIGGGIICNGDILGVSAEIGHMSIDAEGEKCPCGNYGCLESYASARAILSKTIYLLEGGRESILERYCQGNFYKLTAEDIFRAALDGDMLSRDILKTAGRYLGIGIANMINIMSPEAVILTGGLTGAWDIYVTEAIREASKRAFKDLFDRTSIIPSTLMGDAGIIGSAGLVFRSQETPAGT